MKNKKDVIVNEPIGPKYRWLRPNLIVLAVVIVLVLAGGLLYWKHNQDKPGAIKSKTTAIEDRSAPLTAQDLKTKDYSAYQLRLTVDANDYINSGNYADAQRVLDEITKNVPQDKVISQTYRAYWSLYEHTGDSANRKKYALLTADKLRAEGQTDAAKAFEQDAGS